MTEQDYIQRIEFLEAALLEKRLATAEEKNIKKTSSNSKAKMKVSLLFKSGAQD